MRRPSGRRAYLVALIKFVEEDQCHMSSMAVTWRMYRGVGYAALMLVAVTVILQT